MGLSQLHLKYTPGAMQVIPSRYAGCIKSVMTISIKTRRIHRRFRPKMGLENNGKPYNREVLNGAQRTKINTRDDRDFYSFPRFVQHSDPLFRNQVTALYRKLIPEGGTVLDICSSWTSHLPKDIEYSLVVGHGLNAQELQRNARLDRFFVRDLNKYPDSWALNDNAFDAVLCCCSIQYMQQPEKVFAEVCRVLKPGGIFCLTFTDRMFYEKAISAWRDASNYARIQLVKQYFLSVPFFDEPQAIQEIVEEEESSIAKFQKIWLDLNRLFMGQAPGTDPFFAVYARKVGSRE